MKYTVDRFEGEYAVCEDESGAFVNIERKSLPSDVKSGDILFGRDGKFSADKRLSDQKRAEISALQKKLRGGCTE